MQTARARQWAATACVAVVISWGLWTAKRVSAVADDSGAEPAQLEAAEPSATPEKAAIEPPVPIRGDVKVHRYTVTESADGTTAAQGETVSTGLAPRCEEDPNSAYCSTFGVFFWGPSQANRRFADDIVLATDGGCLLDRYVIRVTGDKDQDGTGTALGGYTVTAALYPNCPSSSLTPTPIPGTELTFPVSAAQAGDIVEVTKQIPQIQDVALPAQLYLAVRFSREKCGVVVGAPAGKGYSADRMDLPAAPCNAWFGGFPRSAYANLHAEIYTRGTCDSTFLGYRNSDQVEGPFSCGVNCRFADDFQLAVPANQCNLVAYEVAFRGAIVGIDLRTSLVDSDPVNGGVIPGTRENCFPQTTNQVEFCRVELDTPFPLTQSNLWVTYRSGSSTLGPIRTCRNGQIGSTENFHRRYDEAERRWIDVPGGDACWGGFDLTLYCEGPPTVGACCDMYVGECINGERDGDACIDNRQCPDGRCEAACRETPEQNCTSSLLGRRNLWQPGEVCGASCVGGGNAGGRCESQDDCSVCQGGTRDGQTCCSGGVCDNAQDNADCVGLGDPWPCCSGEGTGTCPWCVGGTRDGQRCCPAISPNPPGECSVGTCEGPVCVGGSNNGQVCSVAADCPGGECTGSAFPTPCGLSACCLLESNPGFPCRNLTRNECFDLAGPPSDRFQIGQFCGSGGQRCPINSCLSRQGDCFVARDTVCMAGPEAGNTGCDPIFNDCLGTCLSLSTGQAGTTCTFSCLQGQRCARRFCREGDRAGEVCHPDVGYCVGGTRHGLICCPGESPGDPGGVCQNGVCNGGALDADPCCPGGACFACPPNGTCPSGDTICQGAPGCADPFCCTDVCEAQGDEFCCLIHWDQTCADTALEVCNSVLTNDECFREEDPRIQALPIEVPTGPLEALSLRATEGADPGFCCHEEDAGGLGVGTVWYRFTAPPAPEGQITSSVKLSTCDSQIRDEPAPGGEQIRYRAEDSVLAVFATTNPDQGVCENGTACSIELQDCDDGSECQIDLLNACGNLIPVACNDDDPTCTDSGAFPRRSTLCATGLVPGDPYWVLVAGKDKHQITLPRACDIDGLPCTPGNCEDLVQTCDLDIERCSIQDFRSCTSDEDCPTLEQTCELTNYCSRSYTACVGQLDCPSGEQCLNNAGLSAIVPNTGVFQLTATSNCIPQRPRMINDWCPDALLIDQSGFCSINATDCLFDSDCPEQGETCEPVFTEFDLSGDVVGVCVGGSRDGQQCLVRFTGQCPDGQCRAQAGATFDCPGPPNQCAQSMEDEVWYQWIAPADGNVEIDTCERVCLAGQNRGPTCTQDSQCGTGGDCGNPDTGLAVYEGCECPVDNSTIVGCSEFEFSPCLAGSRVSFNATAGQCYLLRLSGNSGGLPNGRLRINERLCEPGDVNYLDPPNTTVDARQPHPPIIPFPAQGINTFTTEAPQNAELDLDPSTTRAAPLCWSFCETENTGSANSFRSLLRNMDETVTMQLSRPLTPNAVSTVTHEDFMGAQTTGVFFAHAGNVNGDDFADAADVSDLVACCLEGNCDPAAMPAAEMRYRCDTDRSGTIAPADLLREIDLLMGAEQYDPGQMGTPKPLINGCAPG